MHPSQLTSSVFFFPSANSPRKSHQDNVCWISGEIRVFPIRIRERIRRMELRQTKACNKVQRIDNEETLKHHSHSNKPISLSIFFSQKLFPLPATPIVEFTHFFRTKIINPSATRNLSHSLRFEQSFFLPFHCSFPFDISIRPLLE